MVEEVEEVFGQIEHRREKRGGMLLLQKQTPFYIDYLYIKRLYSKYVKKVASLIYSASEEPK